MAKLRNTISNKKTITVKLKQNPKEDDQFGSGNLGIQTQTGSYLLILIPKILQLYF